MQEIEEIAIIGGGVAGVTAAWMLAERGAKVTLFERGESLVAGPPFCHLHAGGNLYPDISDAACRTLLRQSIAFAKQYPFVVDPRPTVIVLPKEDKRSPEALLPRVEMLRQTYASLIAEDPSCAVLGESDRYYQVFERKALEKLAQRPMVAYPTTAEEWMIPVAQTLDYDKVQFPLIMVQEYGLNLFRLSAGCSLMLEKHPHISVRMQTEVTAIRHSAEGWELDYKHEDVSERSLYGYLINAAGFRSGRIDDMLGIPCQRMVEFKAAYVSHWASSESVAFPEMIFHGERGTPRGMGQFTPYPEGYVQLHGMTEEITLYPDGLVSSTTQRCQPELGSSFLQKIESQWDSDEIMLRTKRAISHLSHFIPTFSHAEVGSLPLFGAQQIPGSDPSLRVAEVSFPKERYARCEIVKVSSAIDMAERIATEWLEDGLWDTPNSLGGTLFTEAQLHQRACQIAAQRGYPQEMAGRVAIQTQGTSYATD